MPFVFDENATFILISALCAGLMTGCATTSKLIPFVGSETPMQQVLKTQPEIVKSITILQFSRYLTE